MESQSNDLKDILSKKEDIDLNKDIVVDKDTSVDKEYVPSENMKNLMQMMDDESKNIVNKSWSKINRSNKITLLEKFVESETIERNLDMKQNKSLQILLIKSLNNNLLNKQSDIKYDSLQNCILEIKSLKFDEETLTYSLITQKNDIKVNTKTRSKTNIDKLLNNSKKRR